MWWTQLRQRLQDARDYLELDGRPPTISAVKAGSVILGLVAALIWSRRSR